MRYRSNLEAPDLAPYFRLREPPRTNSGHDEPCDPDWPEAGFWTHDEAAILYNVATQARGEWADIGARFGWTAAHVAAANCYVWAVDPEYRSDEEFRARYEWNALTVPSGAGRAYAGTAGEFFATSECRKLSGVVIDGNHDYPEPWRDAMGALRHLAYDCVIMFHDCLLGASVRHAMRNLIDGGFRCRFYWTPNGVGLCWRGLPNFLPPDHTPDPVLVPNFQGHKRNMHDFEPYWSKCE